MNAVSIPGSEEFEVLSPSCIEIVQLEGKKSGNISEINVEEFLTADDDLIVFAGFTEEDILSEITDEMENDDEDTDPSQSLLPSQEALQLVEFIQAFFQVFIHK
ncbi:hypothetical protein AVEN_159036-1 [Araneus ventricosus]|uniref:Uncharacterized protein n=1 Tax=Araneus ventricosus TaxID=182803 RepID=A0A4Y2RBL7_ARAVE|nr:hypothetical protein AVEN_159036-1 [Araneus ventricosus]